MKKTILPIIILSVSGLLHAQNSVNENYVQSKTYIDYPTDPNQSVKTAVTVQYFDGLSRPKQTVSVKSSPLGRDVVSHVEYDAFGRIINDYLPIPQEGTQNGGIYTNPTNVPNSPYGNEKIYGEKLFENSPLDRVLEQKQVGIAWNEKPVKFEYGTNTATDVKKYVVTTSWSNGTTVSSIPVVGNYDANQLYKTTVTDEDGNKTTEFKNAQGQIVLVRKALSSTQDADTYYAYNEYDQLALVIPPEAVVSSTMDATVLNNYCYQYNYDGRSRLVGKKLPGKGWEYMVYDKQDRLVMTQDAQLGLSKQWLFTKYDQFGRPVYTGIYTGTQLYGLAGRASEQTNVEAKGSNNELRGSSSPDSSVISLNYNNAAYPTSSIKILTINYYNSFPRDPWFPNDLPEVIMDQKVVLNSQSGYVRGLLLASYVKNIENDDWTRSFMLYDPKGRLIGSRSTNHLGGSTNTDIKLSFAGLTEYTITRHKRLSTDTERVITEAFTYDHQNRPLIHKHQVDNNPVEILSQNKYNELSQLESKKVGGIDPVQPLQTIDYEYNIRGWMTKINNPVDLGNDMFGYKINYNQIEGLETPNLDFSDLKVTPKFNGNIAEVSWRTSTTQSDNLRRYGYVYDNLNRLLAGFYQKDTNPSAKEYFEKLEYNLNGNITNLKRSAEALIGNPTAFNIDNLTYVYQGNRLTSVSDAAQNTSGYPVGGNTIVYDDNGNMTKHLDKGISQINYNILNLPDYITGGSSKFKNTTTYIYRADGLKVGKTYKSSLGQTITTNYLDGFQYDDKESSFISLPAPPALQFVPTAEGYFDFNKNKYIYNYTDHLGNVRLSYFNNGSALEVVEESNYYPFGLKHSGYNETLRDLTKSYNEYKYNGKELQETGMYDYGARFYMPDIGRWGVVDPLAETSRRWSPYTYAYNNPVRFIDPDGMENLDVIRPTFQDNATKDAYLNEVQKATGNTFSATVNSTSGDVEFTRISDSPVTPEQQAFIDIYSEAIASTSVAQTEIVSNDINTIVGNIVDDKIDITDIAEFDIAGAGGASSGGVLAHETKEQQLKAESGGVKGIYPSGAIDMHNGGVLAENRVNGNLRTEDPETGIDVFHERDMTKTAQTVNSTATGGVIVNKTKIP